MFKKREKLFPINFTLKYSNTNSIKCSSHADQEQVPEI